MFKREKGIRKRVKAIMGQNSDLEGSDLEIAESFVKGLSNALEIDADKINNKDIKNWLINFIKTFVLPIQHAQLITPTQKELYHYGHLLGQYLTEPILLSLQEQGAVQHKEAPQQKEAIFKGGLRTRLQERLKPDTEQVIDEPQTKINETEKLLQKYVDGENHILNPSDYVEAEAKKINYKDYIEGDEDEEEDYSFSLEI
jgi:hypothetical protein